VPDVVVTSLYGDSTDIALGEVHHFGGFVDQHETERDQPVDAARGSTIDDKLQYARSVFHRRWPP
jgi:hypothetical protein